MDFAITFKSDMSLPHMVALAKQAERNGFTYAWSFDSHILWHEVYPILTLVAANTKKMKFGPLVTNPVVRDPTVTASVLATLDELSGGRAQLGIGRGDSSRRDGQEADHRRKHAGDDSSIPRAYVGSAGRV